MLDALPLYTESRPSLEAAYEEEQAVLRLAEDDASLTPEERADILLGTVAAACSAVCSGRSRTA